MGAFDIERRVYTTGHLPDCVESGKECWECGWDEPSNCPLRTDPDYRSYLTYVNERRLEGERTKQIRLQGVLNIYVRHKVPLHWEWAAQIATEEFPSLFPSSASVRQILYANPHLFEALDDGVFRLENRNAS